MINTTLDLATRRYTRNIGFNAPRTRQMAKEKGITNQEISLTLGYTRTWFNQLCARGGNNLGFLEVCKIAELLDVPVSTLIDMPRGIEL